MAKALPTFKQKLSEIVILALGKILLLFSKGPRLKTALRSTAIKPMTGI
jgi:hypothetical protein